MRGNITKRGASSWRIKLDVDTGATGRETRYVTVRGSYQDAQRELTKLLASIDAGAFVEPDQMTVGDYLKSWMASPHGLAPKTAERYLALIENQVVPHLGGVPLQKLKPAHIASWYATLAS